MRAPRVGWIFFFMLLLGGLLAAGVWKLTGRPWIALPVGAAGGFFGVIVFNAMVDFGGARPGPKGPDDPRRY